MNKEPKLTPELLIACQAIVASIESSVPPAPEKPLTPARSKMRDRILEVAEELLATSDAELQARPIAKAADIALGSVYNIFEDLDALVLAVNGRTLNGVAGMGYAVIAEAAKREMTARETLFQLARVYSQFIASQEARWHATLRQTRRIGQDLPPWYIQKQDGLFRLIEELLQELPLKNPTHNLTLYSRTLWGAVNGLITGGFHGNKTEQEKAVDLQLQLDIVIRSILVELTGS